MSAQPISSSSDASQVERAYREIKAGIVDGRYRPGAPLSEVMLARAHRMSRTPVREGLTRLWQEQHSTAWPATATSSRASPSS